MKNFDWKLLLIFIESMAIVYMYSRGYESDYVQSLQELKLRTEQFVNQNVSVPNRLIFRQLGYDVIIPVADTTEAKK